MLSMPVSPMHRVHGARNVRSSLSRPTAITSVYVTLSLIDVHVELSVKDEGIGIPDEDQDKLFQPFQRARNTGGIPGTGLGLLAAKNAVELHNRTISLQSRVNVGTTVSVTFPAIEEDRIAQANDSDTHR